MSAFMMLVSLAAGAAAAVLFSLGLLTVAFSADTVALRGAVLLAGLAAVPFDVRDAVALVLSAMVLLSGPSTSLRLISRLNCPRLCPPRIGKSLVWNWKNVTPYFWLSSPSSSSRALLGRKELRAI